MRFHLENGVAIRIGTRVVSVQRAYSPNQLTYGVWVLEPQQDFRVVPKRFARRVLKHQETPSGGEAGRSYEGRERGHFFTFEVTGLPHRLMR